MHIALASKKVSHKTEANFEDKLTSMFFGTLRYLPSKAIACFLNYLFEPYKNNSNCLNSLLKFVRDDTVKFEFSFWPNISQQDNISPSLVISETNCKANNIRPITGINLFRTEPDLIIIAKNTKSEEIKILIECKWESKESSPDQLIKQWNALLLSEHCNSVHIYLVKNNGEGNKTRINSLKLLEENKGKDIWQKRLHVITWYDVMNAIHNKPALNISEATSDVYEIWKNDLLGMFKRIGINIFNGFRNIKTPDIPSVPKSVLFWRGFNGFSSCNGQTEKTPLRTIFWNSH